MENSLFVGLFSAFDAFTGELVNAMYQKKPELFHTITRSVTLGEILQFESVDALKQDLLEKEIEAFRRESYTEQFEAFGRRFDLKLTSFDRWSEFVEASQRRNLYTHADGKVSEQYLSVCEKAGYSFSKRPKVGEKLTLGPKYFFGTCELVMEVGLMLGQTLWRKVFEEEHEKADLHLNNVVYNALLHERWTYASRVSKFGLHPMIAHQSKDMQLRIRVVNSAIALKFGGDADQCQQLMNKFDWSASLREFRLAAAVLGDDFDGAARIMKEIGKAGEILSEPAYHVWPLFREFRASPQFLSTYEEIYGYGFPQKLQKTVATLQARAETTVEEKRKQLGEEFSGAQSPAQGVQPEEVVISSALVEPVVSPKKTRKSPRKAAPEARPPLSRKSKGVGRRTHKMRSRD
jgi:hypothetical protein